MGQELSQRPFKVDVEEQIKQLSSSVSWQLLRGVTRELCGEAGRQRAGGVDERARISRWRAQYGQRCRGTEARRALEAGVEGLEDECSGP